jgi:DHA1 family bicyclomycin/chloramphenicol resistance-like MFS transporter
MPENTAPRVRIILILGMLMTISPFAIDMYLPSFSQIAEEMNTTASRVSLSVSSYLIGLAFGQIIYGPMLDRFGRRKPLFFGLTLFVVSSFACAATGTTEELVIARFFQALGGCVAWVGAAAMVRDFFPVQETPKIFSLLVLVLGVSPLVAPTVGGFVAVALGWRAIFIILGAIATVTLLVVAFFLPPAAGPDKSVRLRPGDLAKTFAGILREPQFITYTLSGSLAFASLFAYVSGSPVIFMNLYQLDPRTFGILFAMISIGFIGASQFNILLVRHYTSDKIFKTVLTIQLVIGILFLIASLWQLPVYITVIFILLTMACVGMLNPNAAALSLAPFKKNIGSASALSGCIQITIASLVSGALGIFKDVALITFSAVMAVAALLAFIALRTGSRKFKVTLGKNDGEAVAVH